VRRALLILLLGTLWAGEAVQRSVHYDIISQCSAAETARFARMMDAYCVALSTAFRVDPGPRGKRYKLRIFNVRADFDAFGSKAASNFNKKWFGFYGYGGSRELVIYYDGRYEGIFFHEGLHQYAEQVFGNVAEWPQWFNEGLATLFEASTFAGQTVTLPKQPSPGYVRDIKALIARQPDYDIRAFMAKNLADWKPGGHDYALSAVLVSFLLHADHQQIGLLFRTFLTDLKQHRNYDKAFAATFGKVDFAVLNRAFATYVGRL
jgi:hypothetical protein